MTTNATPGWGRAHLDPIRPGAVSIDAAEQLAVQQVIVRYAFALDQHDVQALEAVLTDDATWTFKFANAIDVGPVDGRAAILDFVESAAVTEMEQRRHNLVNVVLHSADAATARAQAYLLLTATENGNARLVGTGFYRFLLQRDASTWRIAELFLGTDNAW